MSTMHGSQKLSGMAMPYSACNTVHDDDQDFNTCPALVECQPFSGGTINSTVIPLIMSIHSSSASNDSTPTSASGGVATATRKRRGKASMVNNMEKFGVIEDIMKIFRKETKNVIVPEFKRQTRSSMGKADELLVLELPAIKRRRRVVTPKTHTDQEITVVSPVAKKKTPPKSAIRRKRRKSSKPKSNATNIEGGSHPDTIMQTPVEISNTGEVETLQSNILTTPKEEVVDDYSNDECAVTSGSPDVELPHANLVEIGTQTDGHDDLDDSPQPLITKEKEVAFNLNDSNGNGPRPSAERRYLLSKGILRRLSTVPSSNRPTSAEKIGNDLLEDYLQVSTPSHEKKSIDIYCSTEQPFCAVDLRFIARYEILDETSGRLDWEEWNNKCFKIEYLIRWVEQKMIRMKGNNDQMVHLSKALQNHCSSVIIKMRALADNKFVLRSHTTVQLFYLSLHPVLKQLMLHRDKVMDNLHWSLNLLSPPAPLMARDTGPESPEPVSTTSSKDGRCTRGGKGKH